VKIPLDDQPRLERSQCRVIADCCIVNLIKRQVSLNSCKSLDLQLRDFIFQKSRLEVEVSAFEHALLGPYLIRWVSQLAKTQAQ
jgi:hypothetical protein